MLPGSRATTRGAAHPTTLLNEVCGVDSAVAGQMAAFLPNRCFRHFLKPRMDTNKRESGGAVTNEVVFFGYRALGE